MESEMSDMADLWVKSDVSVLPLAPKNPLPYRQQLQYLPFGGVPRTCIGDHFSMREAALALATSIRWIEIRSTEDVFPIAVPSTTVAAAPYNLAGPR
jgi:cytochrome P450